jgi:hypothetical protein
MPADPPSSDLAAALELANKLLFQQLGQSTRANEILAYGLEEDLLARKRARQGPKIVTEALAQVYSQNYEDAIVATVFGRIGEGDRRFIEIGVENGIECNTRLLLQQGWRGLWIEGDGDHCAHIRKRFAAEIADRRLTLQHAFLTRENVNAAVAAAGFAGPVDFLSVDLDMNTHHIWRALETNARVACIEYNANYPPGVAFEVPYKPDAMWDGSNWYGASLKALEAIGRAKEMALVGCDLMGVNAFFVAAGEAGDKFLAPFDAETHYEPARYWPLKVRGHRRAK